ncbi:hypothetical protein [Mucilaginibacter sp.]|uniref:hypothetical protein n=1 Tax=Mucilaginibacter sp. TaxID=1882438 RepID=UPI003B00C12F
MLTEIYQPFDRFNFGNKTCFLSGKPLQSEEEKIQVFPAWLLARYNLYDAPFKMLDENFPTYKDLKLPCSAEVNNQYLEPLETEIKAAFEQGFEAVQALDEWKLFIWAGKIMYGIIFNELQSAIRQQYAQGEGLNISQSLMHKFSSLHIMLQMLFLPIIFEDFKPYSFFLFKISPETDQFNYRDEINSLTFSLRLKDFGFIFCLQDNGANGVYHQEILQKIALKTLHPIQFEEFCGRIFYSAYLFNRLPEYNLLPVENKIYVEAMPLKGLSAKPLFDEWKPKVYGQVLENFWKPWGFLLLEIIKNPEQPMSFLVDKNSMFIPAEAILLPG